MNELIKLEIERGDEALKSAELLLAAGLQRDAMSRTYYAVLHYARALLATKSLSPKSHQGVLQVFSQHFVKTGLVEVTVGRVLSRQQKLREESDYTIESRFTPEAVEAEIADACFVKYVSRLQDHEPFLD